MKPDYKNWFPTWMLIVVFCVCVLFLALTLVFALTGIAANPALRWVLTAVFGLLFIFFAANFNWCVKAHKAFSYTGERQLAKQTVEGVAAYVFAPPGGKILDVGCGSGALTIACAKRNPDAAVTGVDRWGKEYPGYGKAACEANAAAEGVKNVVFQNGDAMKLDFPNESFDAVTSNYVYHNIPKHIQQQLLRETLRVLKKGGMFAIHDLMIPRIYGDMNAFVAELKQQGYEKAELICTTNGMFTSAEEAKMLHLEHSTILYGIK
ncbi:MAG TPA: class I SAM-dependent methyltransferase [Eubacteriales bacterium]|nr:class I SAM-dependent methyltransferase [Eubacteriales bacterium]